MISLSLLGGLENKTGCSRNVGLLGNRKVDNIGAAEILTVLLVIALAVGVRGKAEITTATTTAHLHGRTGEKGDAEYEAQEHEQNRERTRRTAGKRSDLVSIHAALEHKRNRENSTGASCMSKGIAVLAFIVLSCFLRKKRSTHPGKKVDENKC